jgi:alkylation response protein AidB-like acyl-CoA dehydrogenase
MASGIFSCANLSLANYAFLTVANANMLRAFGTEDQRRRYLPPMLEGRWFGTMCLSEPQAGSSLADIATKAEPLPDGFYRLKGSKMWISGGDHELADNIVHMVLAKIPGGPPGVKGISLFLAPRCRVEADGSLGSWNNIALAGLNHKMGQRGTVNCLLNFSEGGDTLATLIGEPGKGLAYMFHMMNEARLGVGHAAAMCGLGGYLSSLDYAHQRLQGRLPNNKDPSSPPVPIIEHADVKRMLLAQKAAVEGAMALTGYCAYLVDLPKIADDDDERERLDALLGVLTPVAKSWPSEHCLEANKLAIQILGGYGYTRDFPVERFYRDNRLNPIHEGALGIQAIDLLGRKVRLDGGRGFDLLCAKIEDAVALGRLEPSSARKPRRSRRRLISCARRPRLSSPATTSHLDLRTQRSISTRSGTSSLAGCGSGRRGWPPGRCARERMARSDCFTWASSRRVDISSATNCRRLTPRSFLSARLTTLVCLSSLLGFKL